MRKTSFIIGFSGLLGLVTAALFYYPTIDAQYRFLCPVCPYITSIWATPFLRFVRFTLIFGPLNAILFAAIGLMLFKTVNILWKRFAKSQQRVADTR
jgi:hypothetical protein